MTLAIGSLFSGIGGLELGLEWAGVGATAWQVERDPWARSVLAKHWPDVPRYDDVRTVTAATVSPVEVLCGGFPCQDLSFAGKGAGLGGARSGLFFEVMRIADELGPRWIVLENVAAILSRGLDVVLGRLAESGYDAWWDCVPASACGAMHRRDRWFLVGYASGNGGAGRAELQPEHAQASKRARAENNGPQLEGRTPDLDRTSDKQSARPQPLLGGTPHGLPPGLDRYPKGIGPDQYPFEPPRVHQEAPDDANRLRGLGNAVVPQVGFVIGKALLHMMDLKC